MSFADELVEAAIKGQKVILEEMLKARVPLVYTDEKTGKAVQKNPDGSIVEVEDVHKRP